MNFIQLSNATCHLNPKAINQYYRETYYRPINLTDEDAMAILKDKRNYHFRADVVTSVGKLCDVIVNPEAFKTAVMAADKAVKATQ